jgi:hypothetical protein
VSRSRSLYSCHFSLQGPIRMLPPPPARSARLVRALKLTVVAYLVLAGPFGSSSANCDGDCPPGSWSTAGRPICDGCSAGRFGNYSGATSSGCAGEQAVLRLTTELFPCCAQGSARPTIGVRWEALLPRKRPAKWAQRRPAEARRRQRASARPAGTSKGRPVRCAPRASTAPPPAPLPVSQRSSSLTRCHFVHARACFDDQARAVPPASSAP